MAAHLLAFADALGLTQIDLLGFSLGGMVAQQVALDRPSLVRKMLLVGTAPQAMRTSCTWRSRSSGEYSRTPAFPALRCWCSSSLPRASRARRPARRSSRG